MCRRLIRRANPAVLRAIETPTDSGVEDRLDEVAARLADARHCLAAYARHLDPV